MLGQNLPPPGWNRVNKQKIFWVLVLSFMYLVSVDSMDRSYMYLVFVTHSKKMSYLATTVLNRLVENSLLPSFAFVSKFDTLKIS